MPNISQLRDISPTESTYTDYFHALPKGLKQIKLNTTKDMEVGNEPEDIANRRRERSGADGKRDQQKLTLAS
jgi:hypothetical protein